MDDFFRSLWLSSDDKEQIGEIRGEPVLPFDIPPTEVPPRGSEFTNIVKCQEFFIGVCMTLAKNFLDSSLETMTPEYSRSHRDGKFVKLANPTNLTFYVYDTVAPILLNLDGSYASVKYFPEYKYKPIKFAIIDMYNNVTSLTESGGVFGFENPKFISLSEYNPDHITEKYMLVVEQGVGANATLKLMKHHNVSTLRLLHEHAGGKVKLKNRQIQDHVYSHIDTLCQSIPQTGIVFTISGLAEDNEQISHLILNSFNTFIHDLAVSFPVCDKIIYFMRTHRAVTPLDFVLSVSRDSTKTKNSMTERVRQKLTSHSEAVARYGMAMPVDYTSKDMVFEIDPELDFKPFTDKVKWCFEFNHALWT